MDETVKGNKRTMQAKPVILYDYRLADYDAEENKFIEKLELYSPSFPVVLKSDGTVWDKAALYLNYLLIEKQRSSKLLKTVAYDLLDFLRFMEENEIGMLHLPDEQEQRISYRYRQYLMNQETRTIEVGKKGIKRNTASQRINRIINFYNFCFDENLFNSTELENRVYKKLKVKFWFFSEYGTLIEKKQSSTDLAIKRTSKSNLSSDSIQDGRQLHPLTEEEQEIFFEYLKNYTNRAFQLICYIAVNTGARIQAICTLRVNDIKNMINDKLVKGNLKKLIIGYGTTIDNKQDKRHAIFFPNKLVEIINEYIESEEWKERKEKSYYKNENNYVFLSKFGNSFYTSKKEIQDRKYRVLHDEKKFVEKSGESVRKNLNDLLELIYKECKTIRRFSIHDLRATFGLNLLYALEKSDLTGNEILDEIKERMGHSSLNTTMNYLNYSARNKAYEKVSKVYAETLYRFD